MKDYVEKARRTDVDYLVVMERLKENPKMIQLLHSVLGLGTEIGEFQDMVKRWIFYGKEFDRVNGIEELGDIFWYSALAIDVLKTTLEEVMTVNIKKLQQRYPEKFSEGRAVERDIINERGEMESNIREI